MGSRFWEPPICRLKFADIPWPVQVITLHAEEVCGIKTSSLRFRGIRLDSKGWPFGPDAGAFAFVTSRFVPRGLAP